MTFSEFTKGKWLSHPLHPIFVHIPVALLPAGLFFDLLSRLGMGGNALVRLSFSAIALGVIGALLAVPFGIADWTAIKKENPAWKLGLYHMGLNLVAVLIFGVNLGLRFTELDSARAVSIPEVTMSSLGTFVLLISTYLGGRMVFHYGIGVARFSKGKWRRQAELSAANVAKES